MAAPLPHLGAGRSGKHDGRRKLLEAKENAVRAVLFEADGLAVIWFMLRNGNDGKIDYSVVAMRTAGECKSVCSGRARACANDRSDVLATQRRRESSGDESVHDLYALDVPRICHELDQRTIKWQRALELGEFGDACLAEQLCLFPVSTMGVTGVNPIHVLHDCEPGSSQRVGEQKCAGVSPMERDA